MANNFKYFLLGIFIILALATDSQGQCVTELDSIYTFIYAGKSYEIIKEPKTWVDAAACAVERGGYLAEINSKEENDTLDNHTIYAGINGDSTKAFDGGNGAYLWIGGNDFIVDGDWYWDGDNDTVGTMFFQGDYDFGTAVGGLYNNWPELFEGLEWYKEPDGGTSQNALGFSLDGWPNGFWGEWNDIMESNTLYYVIEYATIITSAKPAINSGSQILLFPNPVSDMVHIDLTVTQTGNIEITNSFGQLIIHVPFNNIKKLDIGVAELTSGMYIVNIYTGGNLTTLKFIKE
ncbi:MAG: T9SS type A sorting domain-containing protein [Bacteroidetes bacterium]|nr:T9SS type A sorting domain-containing protein [Bacteroidota bacterium]